MFCLEKLLPAAPDLLNCSLDLGKVGGDCVLFYLLHKEVFAVVHSGFGFAGRRGSRKAKGWPADTCRKGRENPYLPRPVGDRERHTQQVFLSAVGGMCVCTVNCP